MSRPGLFISFEGIDGAGKSSHIEGLAAAFRTQGRTVIVSREPGGTPLAEKLREMVLNDPMDALTESLLIFAARRDHLPAGPQRAQPYPQVPAEEPVGSGHHHLHEAAASTARRWLPPLRAASPGSPLPIA